MTEILKAVSYKDQIYKMIKNRILNQEYAENEILNERKISEQLKVSRTPVREALKALESEDWVEYIPYKGIIVKQLGYQDLKEIFQLRKALESLMIELAIPNITADDIKKLQEYIDQQAEIAKTAKKDYEPYLVSDTKFHDLLIDSNPNQMLRKYIQTLREKITRLAAQSLYSGTDRFFTAMEEHQQIVNAIKDKDVKTAKAAMEHHIDVAFQCAENYLKASGKTDGSGK